MGAERARWSSAEAGARRRPRGAPAPDEACAATRWPTLHTRRSTQSRSAALCTKKDWTCDGAMEYQNMMMELDRNAIATYRSEMPRRISCSFGSYKYSGVTSCVANRYR